MKPIYFPYTFVPSEIVEAGAACFEQMIVYQPSEIEVSAPMMEAEKKGLLDIRVPVKGDEKRILSVLNDYKRWSDVHKEKDGIRLALPRQHESQIPFFNESSIMKIRQDIQRKIRKSDSFEGKSDPLFTARVFLHMAHEFDMQTYDIEQRFRHLNLKEHELMKNLKGSEAVFDKDGPGEEGGSGNDPFDFMVLERIEAWSGLMLNEQEQNETSGLFVTSNRFIFIHMIENSSAGEMVLDAENIPIGEDTIEEMHGWRDSLMRNVVKFTKGPWPVDIDDMPNVFVKDKAGRKISLSLYIIPGKNPLNFFARFYPHKAVFSHTHNERQKNTNTLLGLFEFQP